MQGSSLPRAEQAPSITRMIAWDSDPIWSTVDRKLAFFMPCLRPGMRVLDGGCGSGSITLGLADAVQPGEVVGVDVDVDRLTAARKAASDHGITNVRFEQASLL